MVSYFHQLCKTHQNSYIMKMKEKENINNIPNININHRGWKVMPFIIGNETFEKLGAIGTLSNLLIYLTAVFNLKSIKAVTIITIFNGTTNFATFIGAYLCDTYFGRYYTLGFATVASFLGLLVIQLTAMVPQLHPPHCGNEEKICKGPSMGQMAFLLTGFGLMIIGAGGVRPCNLAFGADQFDPDTQSGKQGINSFFNWYYFTFTCAQMVSLTFIIYIQSNVSWALGLGIPAALMFLSCVLYFMGSKLYVKVQPNGSPMASVVQVIVVAFNKRNLNPCEESNSYFNYIAPNSINSQLTYTNQFKFLDKAAIQTTTDIINPDGSPADPWKLCSIQKVEELKCLVRVIPIWVANIVYSISNVQQHTYVVFQALQMDRSLGKVRGFKIPAASYYVFAMLAMTIWIPIYDRIIVPFFRRMTGKEGGITLLQRMGVGMVLAIVTMVVSGLVEERRRVIALTRPTLGIEPRRGSISSMSGLWLIPQLTLNGLGEAFTIIAQVEFYYKQFPENMRSMGGSIFFCGLAAANYLTSLLITIVDKATRGSWLPEDLNKGRLHYFYYMIAVLQVVNFGYFIICARWYKYKGDKDEN